MLTKDEWKKVEVRLSHPYGRVELAADGHRLTCEVRPYKGLRFCIVVFIDGVIDGKWMNDPAPPARKFWRERKQYLYSAAKRAEARAQAKKRGMPADVREFWTGVAEAFFVMFVPNWPSAKGLCRHLRKVCDEVSLAEPAPARIEETTPCE
ncbi:MAG TPA: hypothetical protein PLN31_09460 [Azoarcus taiwanensis]|nr:hypothetical protein [Azoarcus taiwanensis]